MDTLRTLVADDEPLARERIARLLRDAGCEVIAELEDGPELLEWMADNPAVPVDVIFLDIQMPGLNGLETLAELANPPLAVFVTAHGQYAIQAFEAAAIDYLLKPVYEERLAKTLQRIRNHQVRRLTTTEWQAMIPPLQRVSVKAGAGYVLLDLKVILYFELVDEKVWAVTPSSRHQTRWTAIKEAELAFPAAGMIRIQRNILLRPEVVIACKGLAGGRLQIRLLKGIDLVVSRGMVADFKARLSVNRKPGQAGIPPSAEPFG